MAGLIEKGGGGSVQEVPVDSLIFSTFQPRTQFDDEALQELAASIKEHGVLQPIVVRRVGAGYEVIAGERRVRACKLAGVSKVPAVVREVGDEETAVLALVENLQRSDLSAIEEATGYQRLMEQFGWSQQEVAQKVGRSQSSVANKLRLLRLPQKVREGIAAGVIGERHARALLKLASEAEQVRLFELAAAERWTVERLEAEVERVAGGDELARWKNERREGTGGLRGARKIRVVRDIRIFLNSFRQIFRELKKSGVSAVLEEKEEDGCIEVLVRIELGQGSKARSVQG